MAFSDFTLSDVKKFGLTVSEVADMFAGTVAQPLPGVLAETLSRYLPLASTVNTEKIRSELLIAPLLTELKFAYPDRLSVFSGIDFTVDAASGLNGRCDFILSRSPLQLELMAPACVVVVEAKNEDIIAGIPQCLAELVAAQRFNSREGMELEPLHGVVTTGVLWRFVRLTGTRAEVDGVQYFLHEPERIYGILTYIALGTA